MNNVNVSTAEVLASNRKFCQIISAIIYKHPYSDYERSMREHAMKIAGKLANVHRDNLESFQFCHLSEMIYLYPTASEDVKDGCDKILKIYREEVRHQELPI